jgi:hypothetical protein
MPLLFLPSSLCTLCMAHWPLNMSVRHRHIQHVHMHRLPQFETECHQVGRELAIIQSIYDIEGSRDMASFKNGGREIKHFLQPWSWFNFNKPSLGQAGSLRRTGSYFQNWHVQVLTHPETSFFIGNRKNNLPHGVDSGENSKILGLYRMSAKLGNPDLRPQTY